jgi:hypothetical protein
MVAIGNSVSTFTLSRKPTIECVVVAFFAKRVDVLHQCNAGCIGLAILLDLVTRWVASKPVTEQRYSDTKYAFGTLSLVKGRVHRVGVFAVKIDGAARRPRGSGEHGRQHR